MNKIPTLILMIITLSLSSQTTFEKLNPFISIGVDPKMATNGPGHDWGNSPSLDYEVRIGYYPTNENNIRIWHAYKSHKRIGFQKWTYLAVDKKLQVFSWMNLYGGLEMSGITRRSFTYHYTKPNDYLKYTTNPLLFGGNLEVQITPSKSRFSIGLKWAMYQSEDILKKHKKVRKDFTMSICFHLFKQNLQN